MFRSQRAHSNVCGRFSKKKNVSLALPPHTSQAAHFVSVRLSGGYLVRTLAPIASEPNALCHHHSYIGLIVPKLWLSTELPLRRPTIHTQFDHFFFLVPVHTHRNQHSVATATSAHIGTDGFSAGTFGLAGRVARGKNALTAGTRIAIFCGHSMQSTESTANL